MVFLQNVCLHHMHAWYLKKPEKTLDSLKLELETVVSHHVGVEYQIQVLYEKQPVLSIAEPSLLFQDLFLNFIFEIRSYSVALTVLELAM